MLPSELRLELTCILMVILCGQGLLVTDKGIVLGVLASGSSRHAQL